MMMHSMSKDAHATHLVDQYNIILPKAQSSTVTNMMVSEPTTAYSPVDTFNEAGAI